MSDHTDDVGATAPAKRLRATEDRSQEARTQLSSSSDLRRYFAPQFSRLPKYAQLRQALAAAIDGGYWKAGSQLPTEIELAGTLPFSLGTVQKAIRALVDEGRLRRIKGRGTFVIDEHRGISQPFFHARFLDDTGEGFLPVFSKLVSRDLIQETGPWSKPLGQKGKDIARIERELNVNGEFLVFSRFYINAERFARFVKKPRSELNGGNFKLILAREYNLRPITFSQLLSLGRLPDEICQTVGVRHGTTGAILAITATTHGSDAVYFHEVFIPPNARILKLPDMTLSTGR